MRNFRSWFTRHRGLELAQGENLDALGLIEEIEADLREVDFEEVTIEDRVTLIEREVIWQVRCALASGRFDLALALQRYAVRRIDDLRAAESGFRPVVIRSASAMGGSGPWEATSKPASRRVRT